MTFCQKDFPQLDVNFDESDFLEVYKQNVSESNESIELYLGIWVDRFKRIPSLTFVMKKVGRRLRGYKLHFDLEQQKNSKD